MRTTYSIINKAICKPHNAKQRKITQKQNKRLEILNINHASYKQTIIHEQEQKQRVYLSENTILFFVYKRHTQQHK